ncbi:MAG TPA: ribonuclease PH [Candidatus Dormibacteraeota bacterium]|nr:ribonuclease PH [Candidatus Dormibacteraeota bacterium]
MERRDGRAPDQLRPIVIDTSVRSWAEGVALITMGATTVLCSATIEGRVPAHRRGSRSGWVTAEYAMLPRSTHERSPRERGGRVEGRSQEIQRLIARSLRAAVDLGRLGERTVVVDCDVIHADGGTRTAAISGGYVALALACRRLEQASMVSASPVVRQVAAVSVGLLESAALLDLDYLEDSRVSTDINLVMSPDGGIIEVQGTAEREPFSELELGTLIGVARSGMADIFSAQSQALAPSP